MKLENDMVFDTLLTLACAETRAEQLTSLDALPVPETTTVVPFVLSAAKPHRRRKLATVALVAAIGVVLCAGVYAVWPSLHLEYKDGRLTEAIENAPEATDFEQMQFTYLPDGYAVEWTANDKDQGLCEARVSYEVDALTRSGEKTTMGRSFLVRQRTLQSEMTVREELGEEQAQEMMDAYEIKESSLDITPEDIKGETLYLCWVSGDYLYQFINVRGPEDETSLDRATPSEYLDARNSDIVMILQGIKP